jgi:ribonucleotide reductase alpha subunit
MYTYEEALAQSLQYFNGNELAANVFLSKYALRDKQGNLHESTPDEMHRRLAKEFARIEAKKFKQPYTEDFIYGVFKNYAQLIPQGSPMYGIGNPYRIVSLSNCFVIESPHDSYAGIFLTDQQIAQISKRRGGVGSDISTLRPDGESVNNSAATTSGATSFMHRFSYTGNEVGQKGRRGAQMITISVHHPDILKFATIKNDDKSVTGANISIRLTDEFLLAVDKDEDYELRWDSLDGKQHIRRMISAKLVWNTIIHSAWLRAEPGLLFWDNIIANSPADCYSDLGFKTISTNPCYHPDSLLLTSNGYVSFIDLFCQNIDPLVITDDRVSYPDPNKQEESAAWNIDMKQCGTTLRQASKPFITQKNVDIVKIITDMGFELKVTPDHHIATVRGMIQAKDLDVETDHILISTPTPLTSIKNRQPQTIDEHCGLLMGLIAGDGTCDKNRERVHCDFWGDEQQKMLQMCIQSINFIYEHANKIDKYNSKNKKLAPYFIVYDNNRNKIRVSSGFLGKYLNKYYNFNRNTKHIVPKIILNQSRMPIGLFYVAGIFYCDGSVQGSRKSGFSVRLAQSNKAMLLDIQKILHSNGIIFKIYKRRGEHTALIDGKHYKCKSQYELISIGGHYLSYYNTIGFLDSYKDQKLQSILNIKQPNVKQQFISSIKSIKNCEKSDVYCINEPITRSVVVDGITARRCGEIPLSAYDSCRLLVINLMSCVINAFTDAAIFDFDRLKTLAYIAQRLMDDLVDLEIECIHKIIQKIKDDPEPDPIKQIELDLWNNVLQAAENGRRTGTGETAIGDVIAALGIKYGSQDSIDLVDKIYKTMKLSAYRCSVDMAQELGPFKYYDADREVDCVYIQRIKEEDPQLYVDMVKYGRRNIACLTTAPTGSVSTQSSLTDGRTTLFGTTSGIEPCYLATYTRRKRINPGDDGAKVTFIDNLGEGWMEFDVNHNGLELWLHNNPGKTYEDSPYYGSCAPDIDWIKRVELQSAAQQHVDHAISSTINLPNDVKEEEVAKIYHAAWINGLKGITVYRDGCRSGILVEKKKDTFPNERPRELPCDVHHITVQNKQYFVLVGLLDGRPYEVFAGKNGYLTKTIKSGKIIRKRKDFYKAVFDDSDGVELSPITASTSEMEECITRLTSGLLRVGADMHFIVRQLEKVGEKQAEMHSFARSITRALKKYIPDGTKEKGVCEECGAESLIRQEGCLSCNNCGWSKCL